MCIRDSYHATEVRLRPDFPAFVFLNVPQRSFRVSKIMVHLLDPARQRLGTLPERKHFFKLVNIINRVFQGFEPIAIHEAIPEGIRQRLVGLSFGSVFA